MSNKRGQKVSAVIVGVHRDGSDCPVTGEDAHQHTPSGRPLSRDCAAHGGRIRFEVRCDCGHNIPAAFKLLAIEHKALHLALHRGALTVTRVVDDGEGPTVISKTLTLAS
ncbi:hypothetical protein [Actinacidiphila yeochonensis]|uniref:hypothetical protein n=1 Tax=Actinacidiphila yeochonensis TaxID=89050 RepID=UPI00068A5793|nr:hypothetical protein [Actinacidiphila yeochonensis]